MRGADLLAADGYGQSTLHHLLGCFNRTTKYGPSIFDISLKSIFKNYPSLIKQPTSAGMTIANVELQNTRPLGDVEAAGVLNCS